MTARIHLLPVTRIEHDHEGSLSEAGDLSNVVLLDRWAIEQRERRKKRIVRVLRREPAPRGEALTRAAEHFMAWQREMIEAGMEIAAKLGTAPWWVP